MIDIASSIAAAAAGRRAWLGYHQCTAVVVIIGTVWLKSGVVLLLQWGCIGFSRCAVVPFEESTLSC